MDRMATACAHQCLLRWHQKRKEVSKMKLFSIARHWVWVAPLVLGVMFIAGGLYMVGGGRDAMDAVRYVIVRENITTSEDVCHPNVEVSTAATAKSEEQAV